MDITYRKSAFTLVELLIAVTIIALITTSVSLIVSDNYKRARDIQRVADIKAIQTALLSYYADNGHFPGPNDGVSVCGQYIGTNDKGKPSCLPVGVTPVSIDTLLAPYMDSVPADPLHDPAQLSSEFVIHSNYFYFYDPIHNLSPVNTGQNCNDTKPHPLWTATCDCSDSGKWAAIIGFYRSETGNKSLLSTDTCDGTQMKADVSHYNIALDPQ